MAIEEQLDLNIDSALEAVNTLEAALADIGKTLEAGFLLAIEAIQGVEVQIQAAVDVLSSNVGQVVSEGLEEASDEPLGVEVEAESGDFSVAAAAADEQIGGISPDINVQVDGDASGLARETQGAIDDVQGGEVTVDVDTNTDVSEAEEQIRGLEDEEINLNANVQGAEDVQSLADSLEDAAAAGDSAAGGASNAAAGFNGSAEAAEKAAEAKKKAADAADETTSSLTILAGAAKVVTGAFGAVIATATGFFAAAVNAQGTLDAFNNTLGDTASAVRDLQIGELNIDLAQLAQNLGSSDEEALQLGQQMGQLGLNVGATDEQINDLSSNIFGVAAAIRASNPAMGDLDTIARQLFQGMQRGGATLARFSIDLNNSAVRMKAAELANKSADSQFSRFELTLAASTLAAEQYGDSIETNITQGMENPIIALGRFRQILGDAIEEMGKPLIVPFLDIIEKSIPVIQQFLQVIADIAVMAIPGIRRALEETIPSVENFLDALREGGAAVGSALGALADTFGGLIAALGPLLTVLLEVVSIFLTGTATILEFIAAIRTYLLIAGGFVAAFYTLQAAVAAATMGLKFFTVALEGLTKKTKVGLVLLAITAAVGIFQKLRGASDSASSGFKEFTSEVIDQSLEVDGLAEALSRYLAGLEKFVQTQKVLANEDLVSDLARLGISIDEFTDQVLGNSDSLLENLAARAAATQYEGTAQQQELLRASEDWGSLTEAQQDNARRLILNLVPSTRRILEEQKSLSEQNEITTDGLIAQAVATGKITEEQFEQAMATNAASGAEKNRAEVLQELLAVEAQKTRAAKEALLATEEGRIAQEELNRNIDAFVFAAATGVVGMENLGNAAQLLGLETAELDELIEEVTKEIETFAETITSQIPSVTDAFGDLTEVTSPEQIIENFDKQMEATRVWNQTMVDMIENGQIEAASVIAEQGPEATAELLRIYDGRLDDLDVHLTEMNEAQEAAQFASNMIALRLWAERKGIDLEAVQGLADNFEENFKLADLQSAEFEEMLENQLVNNQDFADLLAEGGAQAVEEWGEEVASAIEGAQDAVSGGVKSVVEGASAAAESAVPGAAGKLAAKLAGELGAKVTEELGNVTTIFATAFADIGVTLSGAAGSAGISGGRNFINGVVTGFTSARGNAETMAQSVMTGVGRSTLPASRDGGRAVGREFISGVRDGLLQSLSGLLTALRSIFSPVGQIAGISGEAFNSGFNVGRSLASGIEAGIRAGGSQVSRVARDIVEGANRAAREQAETESPSKVWERLGRDLSAGLAQGIQRSSGVPIGAASQLLDRVNSQAPSAGNVVSVNVPVTVMGGADAGVGREIGQLAAAEVRSALRFEGLVA